MASKKFLNPINLVNLADDPSSPVEGEIYYNTTSDTVKVYANGAWASIGSGGSASDSFKTISVTGQSSVVADSSTDTLSLVAGTNVSITTDAIADSITINSTGNFTSVDSITYPDYITFDTTPETVPTATGSIFWDDGDGLPATVLNANVTIGLGQEQVALVKNATGASIAKGKVVYINGAAGQRPTIALSDADTEATSSKTFGLTAESIADGAEAFVTTFGVLRGVNTLGLTEGAALWLSSTAGSYTTTVPAEPAHSVFLGYVVKAHATAGEIFVNIQNGYELTELHGVIIDGTPADNEVLAYDSTSGLWINQTAAEAGLQTVVSGVTDTEIGYLDGVTSAIQTQIDSKQPTFTGYDYEIHVSQTDGNDTTGNGDLLTPVATITKALTLITGNRKTVIVHPGTYTESPSITTQYTTITGPGLIGGNIVVSGTISTNTGCTISGIKMTNLTITTPASQGNVNILNCEVSGTLTKSSNADYAVFRLCDFNAASITGAGLVAIFGGNPNFITVNNASANVIVKSAVTVAPVLTAGTLSLVDSVVGAAVTNAVTSAASSIITLANCQFLTSSLTGVAPVVLNGFYSILNCVYDKPNSTLVASSGTGGSSNSVDYFQFINADKFITQGGTSLQYVMGDGSLSNGFTGGTVSGATNFTNGLTANTISATTYQNLPVSGLTGGDNISVTGSNGNFTISFTGTTGSNFTGGTVSGATIFTDGLTANTISATTYQNLPVSAVTNGDGISASTSGGVVTITNTRPQGITGVTGTDGLSSNTTNFITTIINIDKGSSQNIFKNIQIGGITQFSANSNNSDLNFSGIGITITSAATNTLVFTNSITQGITGITAGYGISADTSNNVTNIIQVFDYGKSYTTGNNLNFI
jgi:hypothetical protein